MPCAGWAGGVDLGITNQGTKAEQRALTCASETQQAGTGSTVLVLGVFFSILTPNPGSVEYFPSV